MMYRFLFIGHAGEGFSHCEHAHFEYDIDAFFAARHRLQSHPKADKVYIYRMASNDTCGPMSYVCTYSK